MRHLTNMQPQRTPALACTRLQSEIEKAWNIPPIRDAVFVPQSTVLERREHCAAKALVKGRRWYALKLLEFQNFPSRRSSCRL